MTLTPTLIGLSAVVGLGAGVLAGMFGLGGGLLINPILIAVVGVPAPVAVGTGVCQIIGAATSGVLRRRHTGMIDVPLALTVAGGSVMGVSVGAFLLDWLKRIPPLTLWGNPVPAAEFTVLLLFVAVVVGEVAFISWDLHRVRKFGPMPRKGIIWRVRIPPYGRFPTLEHPRLSIPALTWIGLVAGTSTGLLGIGGGLIMVPAFVYLVGQRTHAATGTSLTVAWFASVVGGSIHAWNGNVHLGLLAALLAGSTIGAQIGASIGARISGPRLRGYFVVVLLAVAALSLWKLGRLVFAG